jgi:hypothetical protein
MNQSELLTAFEAGTIESADFSHAHHVHVAWGLAHHYGTDDGLQRMISGVRQIATRAGRPDAFHLTITKAWFELIATVDDLRCAPELLDKTILSRYYSPGRLAEGRDRWVEPPVEPARQEQRSSRAYPTTPATSDQSSNAPSHRWPAACTRPTPAEIITS